MTPKIAVIYTTFLRSQLVKETLPTIVNNTNSNCVILVGDQGKTSDNVLTICSNINSSKVKYYKLPFDCGLSYARNFLVQKAYDMNINYCIITADSIAFTQLYDFQPIINFLEHKKLYGTVGFDLQGRICWECDIKLIEGDSFFLDIPRKEIIIYNNINFQEVDLHRNFFMAKTKALLNTKWDNNLKMLEHEDHAYRWKHNKIHYKRFYTDYIIGKYINFKTNEYNKYRSRTYNEFMLLLRKKYNITGWVKYSDDLRKRFNTYKNKLL